MGEKTSIEWCDATWNPVHGCSKVSPGCANCYAETLSRRYGQTLSPWTPANAAENVTLKPLRLDEPKKWREPKMVFVNSMSDLFHELVPDEYVARVFDVMAECPRHVFQILTKRPERMRDYRLAWHAEHPECGTLPNVWLGVSIENRRFVSRADVLREIPAAVRFISAEPLLGPLVPDGLVPSDDAGRPMPEWRAWKDDCQTAPRGLDLTGIDQVIVGGETGPGHRRMDLAWARDLRDACRDSGTAFFMKQLGGARPGTKLEDLPPDLRIREYPDRPVVATGSLF